MSNTSNTIKMLYTGSELREKLESYRKTKHFPSIYAWAKEAGVGYTTLNEFMNGTTNNLSFQILSKLAYAGNTSVGEMLGSAEKTNLKKIPIAGCVPGGNPCEMIETENSDYVYFDTDSDNAKAVKIVGDSMDKANLPDGAFAIVDCDLTDFVACNGKVVVLLINGESTCKRFKLNPTRFCPESTNTTHEDYFPTPQDEWKICGQVIGTYIKFN